MSNKDELEAKANELAAKFSADCQALFDSPAMSSDIADGDVFQDLLQAQRCADDAARPAN